MQGHNGFNSELFKDKYDIIVSNPPYVRMSEKEKMMPNVLNFEPHTALFVEDDDPLLYYKIIADFARIKLEMGGLLFFEINEAFEAEVIELLNDKGFRNVQSRHDINGKPRLARAQMKAFDRVQNKNIPQKTKKEPVKPVKKTPNEPSKGFWASIKGFFK
jgi:methylase of polypeptide subunit release factors